MKQNYVIFEFIKIKSNIKVFIWVSIEEINTKMVKFTFSHMHVLYTLKMYEMNCCKKKNPKSTSSNSKI